MQSDTISRRIILSKKDNQLQEEINNPSKKDKIRKYDMILEFGLGNFACDIFEKNESPVVQSVYMGDMVSIKPMIRVDEKKRKWSVEMSGELFRSTYRLERWWSEQKVFRINKLMVSGLCVETLIRYHFEETALYPFPVLAQTNIGLGFVYRFHGLQRKDMKPADVQKPPKETDFALFGIEPNLGFKFTMDDGRMIGYIDMGTGAYGASIEDNYGTAGPSSSPENTHGRSVLGRIGIKGERGRINYQIGYSVFRLKIKEKDTIPESRTKLDKIICNLGIKF
ncbi:MAG: hypothetical protein ACMUHX_01330 [bacterium]